MRRILVVDDDPAILHLVSDVITDLGYSVSNAPGGEEALEALGIEPKAEIEHLPELIILDIMMPVVDGVTVAKRAAADPRTRDIPIVIVSAKGSMRGVMESAPNVSAFLEKPFDIKKLGELIATILKR